MRASTSIRATTIWLLLGALLALLLGTAPAAAAEADAKADQKPVLIVVQEADTILADQAIDVHLWVSNPTEQSLARLTLDFSGPSFLRLGRKLRTECAWAPNGVSLAPLAAHHETSLTLCVKADKVVREEDFNVAYTLAYSTDAKPPVEDVVVVEKKVSVGLLGTDTVAGVSLRLIGLVLPGALFLVMLRLAKTPWLDALGAAESAVASVLISIVLSLAVDAMATHGWTTWIATGGASLSALLAACVLAALAALIVIAVQAALAERRRRGVLNSQIAENDDVRKKLMKALQAAQGDYDPVSVRCGTKTYVGSAAARTAAGDIWVLGWYGIKPKDPKARPRLKKLVDAKDYIGALEQISPEELVPSNATRETDPNGKLNGGQEDPIQLPAKDQPSLSRGKVADLDVTDPPLIMMD